MRHSIFVWMTVLACCMACKVAHSQAPSTCTLTLTGAVTAASVPCQVTAGYEAAKNQTALVVNATSAPAYGSALVVVCGIKASGQGTAGATYSSTSPGVTGACTVQLVNSPATAWVATKGNSSQPDQGTFQASLTSMGVAYTSSGNSAYLAPTGSMNATLPPLPLPPPDQRQATGTITVTVSFHAPAKFAAPPPGAGKNPVQHAPVTNQPVTKP